MRTTARGARVLALMFAVLLGVAVLLTPLAMWVGAVLFLSVLLRLTSGQAEQRESRNDQRNLRRRLAHEASQEFRQRWAASAGVAGKLGSSMMRTGGSCAAKNDPSRFAYHARDQDEQCDRVSRGSTRRRAHRVRDRPMRFA